MEAEKRTINYLIHILKLDDTNIVKSALKEQMETYRNKPEKKTWLRHAINCCIKYNINYELNPSSLLVKQIIHKAWISEYQQLLNATTLKYYRDKTYPKLNWELNFYTGGEFWLKAKAGALLLNSRTNSNCTRCNEGITETIEHLLWTCKANFNNEQNRKNLQLLWGFIPSIIEGISKQDEIPSEENDFLELATKWLLSDNSHGQAINISGKIIKKFYNERPEILLYNSIIGNTGNTGNTRNTNGINHIEITGESNDEEPYHTVITGNSNDEKLMANSQLSFHGNTNSGEPRMLGQAIQIHGNSNFGEPRRSGQTKQFHGDAKIEDPWSIIPSKGQGETKCDVPMSRN